MKSSKAIELARRIDAHGRELLRIFPNSVEKDPAKLCKKLRRLELEAERFALRCCNGPDWATPEACDADGERILVRFAAVLRPQNVPIFLNRDPRGHSLKIDDAWTREHAPSLYRDWGGYGIIAPDLRD